MEAEAWVVRLLREVGVNLALKEVEELPQTYDDRTTEEIFCGVLKNKGIGNDMECEAFIVCSYRDAGDHDLGTIYLDGLWSQEMQYLQHSDRDPGRITVRFQACEAYVVLSTDESIEPEVLLDGAPLVPENAGKDIIFRDGRSVIRVDRNGLFNVFHSDRFEVHELSVITVSDRLMVYSFSFH